MHDLLLIFAGVVGANIARWLASFRENPYRYTCLKHGEVFKIKTNNREVYDRVVAGHKQWHREQS